MCGSSVYAGLPLSVEQVSQRLVNLEVGRSRTLKCNASTEQFIIVKLMVITLITYKIIKTITHNHNNDKLIDDDNY